MGSWLSLSLSLSEGRRGKRRRGGKGRRRVRGRLRLEAERRRWNAKRRRSLQGAREMLGEEEEGCKSSHKGRKEKDNSPLSLSFRSPSPRLHPRVSPVSHSVFPVLLPSSGERVTKGGTAGVRERATQVPQSLTRLRLFCHLLLSFELFYRLPR